MSAPTDLKAFIDRVAALGLELRAEADRLLCHGPRRLITRELQVELAARKHEILAHLRERQAPSDAPLSYVQQRLWFMDQMQPGLAAYNLPLAQRIRGPLDAAALRAALSGVVRRHHILRTAFPVVDGVAVQRVGPASEVALATVDLAHLPGPAREPQARRLAALAMAQPFDLAVGPPLHATLYRLDADDHLLLIVVHHMVADGWSVALLAREISALYGANAAAAPADALAPAEQYAAYARWQRESLTEEALARDLAYWSAQLATAPRVLSLPTDRPRPAVASFRGGRVELALDHALATALKAIAQRAGASLFMVLVAACGVLFARHARSRDLVIGTPVAGRNRPEWSSIVGCFVNTLPLRVSVQGDPSFETLLAQVRETSLAAFDHQDLPFERLVEALHPERDLSRNPIVQVSVGLHNARGQERLATVPLPGLEVVPVDLDPGTVRFDVELDFWEHAAGLQARLLYASDLFDAASAEAMAAQLRCLLGAIARDPGVAVSRLPLVSASERGALASRWNPPVAAEPPQRLLHEAVRAQAERTPHAVAVMCGDAQVSYAELVARAAALARELVALGIRGDEPVGLAATRSIGAVAGMLGILEAGAAYVPVDPEHPRARIAGVLADSGARVLVTESALAARFAAPGLQAVCVDRLDGAIAGRADAPRRAHPESLAYVMYTSGSTGRPKGVAVPHRAVVGLLEAMHRVLPLGPEDVFLAVTTFAFDISVLEVFLPLSHGARLVIAERAETLDAKLLARAIERRAATAMQATPATWSLLVDGGWTGAPRMSALCGGEALAPALAQALRGRCARLWNVYGPTETTIWSAADEVRAEAAITIGQALGNGELHVLDEHGEVLPPGMVGEIWIGGHGLARGYLGQPALTARAFRPDPFSGRPGARIYRTGDLGRRRADGRIECLGRIDHQVKFRGFRIEPAEIEAALLAHEAVAKAVVALVGKTDAEQRLVGYVVPAPGACLDLAELRRELQDRLPAYLVPSPIVTLEALPMTPNGKVDRAALPAPSPRAAPNAAAPAGNETERALLRIWAAVLGAQGVGAEDNFFDLGGHSLLLAKVRASIAQDFGREVAILDLFRYPTVRALARHLDGAAGQGATADVAQSASRQAEAIRRLAAAHEARVGDD